MEGGEFGVQNADTTNKKPGSVSSDTGSSNTASPDMVSSDTESLDTASEKSSAENSEMGFQTKNSPPKLGGVPKGRGGLNKSFSAHEQKGTPTSNKSFAPIDILDYIYAVLHSPTYREKYKEFL